MIIVKGRFFYLFLILLSLYCPHGEIHCWSMGTCKLHMLSTGSKCWLESLTLTKTLFLTEMCCENYSLACVTAILYCLLLAHSLHCLYRHVGNMRCYLGQNGVSELHHFGGGSSPKPPHPLIEYSL